MPELPENPDQWPEDPFELLGVSPSQSFDEIRRAWFRLVRRFSPDRFPLQFQRLREAFELAKRRMPGEGAGLPVREPARPRSSDGATKESGPRARTRPTGDNRPPASSPDRLTEFELLVRQGKLEQAESLLGSWRAVEPHEVLPHYGRLLLSVLRGDSDASSATMRLNCLFRMSDDARTAGAARRWLEWDLLTMPQLARLSDWQFYLTSGRSIDQVWNLLEVRWMAIGSTSFETVLADSRLINSAGGLDSACWPELLVRSVDYTIWHSDPECRAHESFVAGNLRSGNWQDGRWLDRLDERLALGRSYRRSSARQRLLLPGLAPAACSLHPLLFAQRLPAFALAARDNTAVFLKANDDLASTCSQQLEAVLAAIIALDTWSAFGPASRSGCDARLVSAFFTRHGRKKYQELRFPLLKFCQSFGTTLSAFALRADAGPLAPGERNRGSWFGAINADVCLRLVERLAAMDFRA